MTAQRRWRRAAAGGLIIAAMLLACAAALAQATDTFKGRSLAEALQLLQAKGLRIVFSSATVTPELRISIEPRATDPRRQLDELLAPHGLVAREGPGGTIQVLRVEATPATSRARFAGTVAGSVIDGVTSVPLAGVVVRVPDAKRETRTDASGRFHLQRVDAGTRIVVASLAGYAPATRSLDIAAGATTLVTFTLFASTSHREYVSVSERVPARKDRGVASQTSVDRERLHRAHGSLDEDPVRVAHAMPGVTPVDEFRSEFAVRGSPFRHVDLVIDGVPTQWLQHTAPGRGATGSVTMFAGQALESMTLSAGAYPHRYGDRLGPQLELSIREGARDRFTMRGGIGGTAASLVGEGPVGRSARGSWLVAARQSYLEWPSEHAASRTPFGFSDALGKMVYDVRANQQLSVTAMSGTATVEGDDRPANELGNGTNLASLVNGSWRSTFGSGLALTHRVYAVRQHFLNQYQNGQTSDRGANAEIGYRAEIKRPLAIGLLEAGAHVARTSTRDVSRELLATAATSVRRSGYAHFAWAAAPTLTLSPGFRVTDATHVPARAVSHWLLGEWAFTRGWALNVATGVAEQLPDIRLAASLPASSPPQPERARHLDVAIEHQLTEKIRWQATLFYRAEHDILREAASSSHAHDDPVASASADALEGSARGIELLIDRRSATGASGWVAYSFGETRYTDALRQQTFWADFDQRHALSLFGSYRFTGDTSVGATFRAGSNFPIPGFFTTRNGRLFVASEPNRVRLPIYARLDVRADRRIEYLGRRVTLFAEVRNVLNRGNLGIANGSIDAFTGEAIGFTDRLLGRRASAGVLVEF